MTRSRVAVVVLVGLAALAAFLLLRPAPQRVDVAEATRGAMQVTVDEEGETRIRHRYVVAAPIDGRLLRVDLDEGDTVKVGDLVARIRPTPLDPRARAAAEARLAATDARRGEAAAQVAKARAALAQARRDLDRARRLFASGTLAPGQRERAELEATSRSRELEVALAAADAVQHDLEEARAALLSGGLGADVAEVHDPACGDAPCLPLRAPVDGRVLRVREESERTVAPGTPILEIGAPGDLEIVADVLSTEAVRIRPGAKVSVEEWGGPAPLEATVRLVEPSGFTKVSALGVEEQRVNVISDFVRPPEGLGDGYRVEVRIVVWEGQDVLRVPVSALFRRGTDWCVFVVEGGRARRRVVEIGERGTADAEVRSGLAAGERVVLHPSDRIDEGVRVQSF